MKYQERLENLVIKIYNFGEEFVEDDLGFVISDCASMSEYIKLRTDKNALRATLLAGNGGEELRYKLSKLESDYEIIQAAAWTATKHINRLCAYYKVEEVFNQSEEIYSQIKQFCDEHYAAN